MPADRAVKPHPNHHGRWLRTRHHCASVQDIPSRGRCNVKTVDQEDTKSPQTISVAGVGRDVPQAVPGFTGNGPGIICAIGVGAAIGGESG